MKARVGFNISPDSENYTTRSSKNLEVYAEKNATEACNAFQSPI